MKFYDTHCHIFNSDHIPLISFIKRYGSIFNPGSNSIKMLNRFTELSESSVYSILKKLIDEIYAAFDILVFDEEMEEIIITPLLIFFEKENNKKTIANQINDIKKGIAKIITEYDKIKIYPFLSIDPTYKNFNYKEYLHIVKSQKQIKNNGDFIGIKLYPPMNINIEEINDDFFEYCQNNEIPITTHCISSMQTNLTSFNSTRIDCEKTGEYSAPEKWEKILSKYNKLKVNFAHFDCFNLKKNIILNLMKTYENVYADISFNLKSHNFKEIRKMMINPVYKKRILFGSDYYMYLANLKRGEYKDFLIPIIDYIGMPNFKLIAEENPKRFLGL